MTMPRKKAQVPAKELLLVQSQVQVQMLKFASVEGSFTLASLSDGSDYAGSGTAIDASIRAVRSLVERGLIREKIGAYALTPAGARAVAAGLPTELPALSRPQALALLELGRTRAIFESAGMEPDQRYDDETSYLDVENAFDSGYGLAVEAVGGWMRDVMARIV